MFTQSFSNAPLLCKDQRHQIKWRGILHMIVKNLDLNAVFFSLPVMEDGNQLCRISPVRFKIPVQYPGAPFISIQYQPRPQRRPCNRLPELYTDTGCFYLKGNPVVRPAAYPSVFKNIQMSCFLLRINMIDSRNLEAFIYLAFEIPFLFFLHLFSKKYLTYAP